MKAVVRHPNASRNQMISGTDSPPMDMPSCEIASALARCRENQLTTDTTSVPKPPRLEPSAIRAKVR